ncbi:MAG: hypothetical protein LBV06_07050 [Propionibacteriaceae bacterium]|jgi:hypothetical protein|nr:hypothetical protein [Propionibacteriaceae bacterium]
MTEEEFAGAAAVGRVLTISTSNVVLIAQELISLEDRIECLETGVRSAIDEIRAWHRDVYRHGAHGPDGVFVGMGVDSYYKPCQLCGILDRLEALL